MDIIFSWQTTPATTNTGMTNPCTVQNLQTGNIYFAISTDKTQFIECDLNGHANVLTCPAQLEWDQSRLSCVYKFTNTGGQPITTMDPNSGALGGKFTVIYYFYWRFQWALWCSNIIPACYQGFSSIF